MIHRGDVYDAELPVSGRRPAVVVTRQEAIPVLSSITVASITTVIRGHPAEVALSAEAGVIEGSVVNCNDLATIPKSRLMHYRGRLGAGESRELDLALKLALGLS